MVHVVQRKEYHSPIEWNLLLLQKKKKLIEQFSKIKIFSPCSGLQPVSEYDVGSHYKWLWSLSETKRKLKIAASAKIIIETKCYNCHWKLQIEVEKL